MRQPKTNRRPKTPNPSHLEGLEPRTLLSATPTGLTPAEVRAVYGFNLISFTNSSGQTVQGNGAGQTIAIVDPYVSSTITSDLNKFDQTFDINGTQSLYTEFGPASSFFDPINLAPKAVANAGWALETALDVEWAHAIAPAAKIDLIEALSPDTTDLLNAVSYAAKLSGVSVVSMSWGGSEFSGENTLDSYFTTPAGHQGVTFVAAAGDTAASVSWPAVSDNVLAVGGTSLKTNSAGAYVSESAWSDSGGGISALEAEPTYQSSVNATGLRATPDVAYDADPNTGFAVYTATPQGGQSGWITVGGTSAGAPQWSSLIAIADQGRVLAGKTTLDGPTQTLPTIYALPAADFHDVASGSAGSNKTASGYDLVTGRGSPVASSLVAGLVATTTTTPTGTIAATGNSGGATNSRGAGNPGNNSGGSGGRYHGWPPPPPPPRFGRGWSNQPPFGRGRYAMVSDAPVADPALNASLAQDAPAPANPATDALDASTSFAQASSSAPPLHFAGAANASIVSLWSQTAIIVAGDAPQPAAAPSTPINPSALQPSASPANDTHAAALPAARIPTTATKAIAVGAFPPSPAAASALGGAHSLLSRLPIAIAEAMVILLFARRKPKQSTDAL